MARVMLTTEGNYPTVIGGVTRWCDLLLGGLAEFDWTVLALGVEPVPANHIRRAPILQPAFGSRPGQRAASPGLVDRLTRALFAATPDPDRLLAALLDCRNVTVPIEAGGPSLTGVVGAAVESVLPAMRTTRSPDEHKQILDLALELVDEVLMVAGTQVPSTDVHLVACAGRAVIPAVIDQALRGTPVVVVEHGLYVHEAHLRTQGPAIDPAVRQLVRRSATTLAALSYDCAAVVVGVSEANCRRSVSFGADPDRTIAIVNGVAVPTSPPAHHGGSVIGTVGRIDPFKGVDVFIRAAREILDREPTARFVHIGPVDDPRSSYEAECQSLVARFALEDRFTFLGAHPDPTQLLPDLDVFVMPSRSEGLPFALLEAMAAARPIVASAVGGVPEALGDAGLLVPSGDTGALAHGVISLLEHPDRAAELGKRAHRVTRERFELAEMLDGYRSLLHSVLPCEVATA